MVPSAEAGGDRKFMCDGTRPEDWAVTGVPSEGEGGTGDGGTGDGVSYQSH